jgi:hypothetical protein
MQEEDRGLEAEIKTLNRAIDYTQRRTAISGSSPGASQHPRQIDRGQSANPPASYRKGCNASTPTSSRTSHAETWRGEGLPGYGIIEHPGARIFDLREMGYEIRTELRPSRWVLIRKPAPQQLALV